MKIVQKIATGSCKKLGETVSRCLLFFFLVEQKVHFARDKYFCDKKHLMWSVDWTFNIKKKC